MIIAIAVLFPIIVIGFMIYDSIRLNQNMKNKLSEEVMSVLRVLSMTGTNQGTREKESEYIEKAKEIIKSSQMHHHRISNLKEYIQK